MVKNKVSRFWYGSTPEEYKFNYNRECCRERMIDRCSLPCIETCIKYNFTREDLMPVIERYLEIVENKIIPEDIKNNKNKYKKNKINKINLKKVVEEEELMDLDMSDTESECSYVSGYSTDFY
tara:strand:- start:3082 stop:3450 length:369 start_codon:yes stop_codon:yes gene_type:complete